MQVAERSQMAPGVAWGREGDSLSLNAFLHSINICWASIVCQPVFGSWEYKKKNNSSCPWVAYLLLGESVNKQVGTCCNVGSW